MKSIFYFYLFITFLTEHDSCVRARSIGHVFVSGARFVETDLTLSLRFTFDWTTEPIITNLF